MTNELSQLLNDLIVANHIIYHNGVVDAFGHISVRHVHDADKFIMSANMAPALVRSDADLVEYWVSDGSPVQDRPDLKHFIERYIHSEIYKRYDGVRSVVHSHAEAVLPYAITGASLKPVFHMSGFLGQQVPTFDIESSYQPDESQDLLVNNVRHGANLASCFTAHAGSQSEDNNLAVPDHNVVLMRRHGFTATGTSIKESVFRAIFTVKNARIQTTSTLLQHASGSEVDGLPPQQVVDSAATTTRVYDRAWHLWVAEVSTVALFQN